MQAYSTIGQVQAPGGRTYAYGLNMVLPESTTEIIINSKRMECDFRLTAINAAFLFSDGGGWHVILGTEQVWWFADFVRAETIFGDGALPHFIPDDQLIIKKGDYIVCQARANTASFERRLALIFQGVHLG